MSKAYLAAQAANRAAVIPQIVNAPQVQGRGNHLVLTIEYGDTSWADEDGFEWHSWIPSVDIRIDRSNKGHTRETVAYIGEVAQKLG